MNFDVCTLENKINNDYEINVSNEVNIVEKLAMKNQNLSRELQQSFIAEILLNRMNLYCRPWHVVIVDLSIMTQLFFVLSCDSLANFWAVSKMF